MKKEIKVVISNVANATGLKKRDLKRKSRELIKLGYTDKQVCDWLWKLKRRKTHESNTNKALN